MSESLSLEKIRTQRDASKLVPRSYKFHPKVLRAFEKRAASEGCTKISLLEKMIVEYLTGARG
jgi:hypothetical protein